MSQFPRGSEWNKWDLHVHTPYSIIQDYEGGTDEEKWQSFLAGLESLPPEFKAIGINDYLFIDGYRRVISEKSKGRLSNITTIFPVLEFRIDKFVGTTSLNKINFHVIFTEMMDPQIIDDHFTHNPNLAVVCDAEQVIVSKHDKKTNAVNYTCGSLESTGINQSVVDILEGTMPAFINRKNKYHAHR